MTTDSARRLRLERLVWGLGLLLVTVFGSARLYGQYAQRAELDRFEQARVQRAAVDTRLWSEGRIAAYEASLEREFDTALAALRIPSIDLDVPVLEGTDEPTLNRAVGWIDGTARPGEGGNVGVAGHRDGFFRGLKDIAIGDTIELSLLDRTETYLITETSIVDPSAVFVLEPTDGSVLTLVTCYPFYYVGPAPQRFVVRAIRTDTSNEVAMTNP